MSDYLTDDGITLLFRSDTKCSENIAYADTAVTAIYSSLDTTLPPAEEHDYDDPLTLLGTSMDHYYI